MEYQQIFRGQSFRNKTNMPIKYKNIYYNVWGYKQEITGILLPNQIFEQFNNGKTIFYIN